MTNKRVEQIRTNALVATHLYATRLKAANKLKITITIFTVITPILVIAVRFLTKGTLAENIATILTFIVSVILLCLTIYGHLIGLDNNIQSYSAGLHNNVLIAEEALSLINSEDEAKLDWFYKYVTAQDKVDKSKIQAESEEKYEAYRASLKELFPGRADVICPSCGASPFKYTKGSCQLCGGTPAK